MKLFFMFTVSIATVIDTMDSVKVLPMYSMISAENGGMAPLIRVFGCVVVVSGQLCFPPHPLTHHFVPREVPLVPV